MNAASPGSRYPDDQNGARGNRAQSFYRRFAWRRDRKVSFSAYLVQPFIIHFMASVVARLGHLPRSLRLALAYVIIVGMTTAAATATWKFIEVPFQRLGRSLIQWN